MLQTKIERIGRAIVDGLTVNGTPVCGIYHYWRPEMQAPFVVWGEDGEDSAIDANDRKEEQAITGFLDYYTKVEYDERVDAIQAILYDLQGEAPFGWRLDSVQYEDETNLIHFQWLWVIS